MNEKTNEVTKRVKKQTTSRAFLPVMLVLGISGCASTQTDDSFSDRLEQMYLNKLEETPADRVIARIDGMSRRPDWLKESEPFQLDSDHVTSLGVTEIPGDHRIDAAYRIAQSNAEAAIAGAIQKRLEFLFQNAEEGTALNDRQARYIAGETTRLVTSSLRPRYRYWEKILSVTDTGRRLVKYRVFTTVEMPGDDFHQAVVKATRRASGKGGLSSDFAEKVERQWKRFVEEPQEAESQDLKTEAP